MKKDAQKIIEEHVAALAEHFGAVQIMVTRLAPNGNTECYRHGSGDWYSRQGMAHEFIAIDEARTQVHVANGEDSDAREGG